MIGRFRVEHWPGRDGMTELFECSAEVPQLLLRMSDRDVRDLRQVLDVAMRDADAGAVRE